MAWTVAFPMYNVSERIEAGYEALFDALVAALRADGFTDAVTLLRDAPLPDVFARRDLPLGQTCGYPYLTRLREQVRLVAHPTLRSSRLPRRRPCQCHRGARRWRHRVARTGARPRRRRQRCRFQ